MYLKHADECPPLAEDIFFPESKVEGVLQQEFVIVWVCEFECDCLSTSLLFIKSPTLQKSLTYNFQIAVLIMVNISAKTEEIFRAFKVRLPFHFQNSSYTSTADKAYLLSVLKISRSKNSLKCRREISRLEMWILSDVSGVNPIPIFVHPEDGNGVIPWHVGNFRIFTRMTCPIIFHWKVIFT